MDTRESLSFVIRCFHQVSENGDRFIFTPTTFVFVSCGRTNGKIKYTWSSFSEIFKSPVLRSNNSQDIRSPYQPQGEVSSHEYHDWPSLALTAVTFWRFSWGVVVRNRSEDQSIEFLGHDHISFKKEPSFRMHPRIFKWKEYPLSAFISSIIFIYINFI